MSLRIISNGAKRKFKFVNMGEGTFGLSAPPDHATITHTEVRILGLAYFPFLLLASGAFAEPLRITNISHSPTGFAFSFLAASNRTYSINCSAPAWNPWGTLSNVQGRGAMAQILDTAPRPFRVYRVFAEPVLRYLTIGHVGPTTARLAVGLDAPRDLRVIYSTNADLANPINAGPFPVDESNDYTRAIDLVGLSAATTYFFNVLIDMQPQYSNPYPSLRTAPPHGTTGTVRFAFGSCYNGTSAGGYGTLASKAPPTALWIWQSIAAKTPDFFLHLGDTAYCDNMGATDLNSYRLVHRHTLDERLANMSSYARFRRHFAIYTTWDDHESINDWPWSPQVHAPWSASYQQNGKQAFTEYHGRGNPDPLLSGELYYVFRFANIGVFMTDTRSFRSCQQGDDSLANISSGPVSITFNGSVGTASGHTWNAGLGFTSNLVGRTIRLVNGQTRYINYHHSPTRISVSSPGPPGTHRFAVLGKTLFGNTQKQHLKDWLLQSKDTLRFRFIATSTPIHGLSEHVTLKDAWGAGYQAELHEILDFIISNQIRNVIFLSGDQHWAGSFNRRHNNVNFFEFMSSPLSSSFYPIYSGTNATLLSRVHWMFDARMNNHRVENFGLVTVHTDATPPTVRFELFDAEGALLNSTSLQETLSGLELAPSE